MNWISVKDKLPKPTSILGGNKFLIRCNTNNYYVTSYMKGFNSKYYPELKLDGFRNLRNDGYYDMYENVTHYMEITEPK